jgi:hypothetical protein
MPRWTIVPPAVLLALTACGDAAPDANNPLSQLPRPRSRCRRPLTG